MWFEYIDKRPYLCLLTLTSSLWLHLCNICYCIRGRACCVVFACYRVQTGVHYEVHPHPKVVMMVSFVYLCASKTYYLYLYMCPACYVSSRPTSVSLCHDPFLHFLSVVLPTALLPFTVYKTSLTVTAASSTTNWTLLSPSLCCQCQLYFTPQLCALKTKL